MTENIGIGPKIWNFFEKTGRLIVEAILGIFKIEVSDKKWDSFMQFVKFGIVGVLNTFISYFVYLIFLLVLGETYYLVGNVVGFFVSVLNSFYWNDKYVFKKAKGEKRSVVKSLIKVFLSYSLTGLVLSNILLVLFVSQFSIQKTIAPLLVLIITIPLNYVMNKVWAFKIDK